MRRRSRLAVLVSGACLAVLAGFGLALDVHAAPATSDAGPSVDAGAEAAASSGSRAARIPPDPPALVEPKQWVFDLRWDKGEIFLLDIEPLDMGEPRATPRVFGRFALELFEGPTLIERVRFDFPMLGAGADQEDAGASGIRRPVSLTARLRTRIGVIFPATNRGTRLELWDRATDQRYALPWPPTPGIVPTPPPPPRPPLVPEAYDVIPAKDAGARAR